MLNRYGQGREKTVTCSPESTKDVRQRGVDGVIWNLYYTFCPHDDGKVPCEGQKINRYTFQEINICFLGVFNEFTFFKDRKKVEENISIHSAKVSETDLSSEVGISSLATNTGWEFVLASPHQNGSLTQSPPEGLRVSGTQCLAVRSETALPRKRRVSHFSDTLVLQPIDR